jgi:hypothetical protein
MQLRFSIQWNLALPKLGQFSWSDWWSHSHCLNLLRASPPGHAIVPGTRYGVAGSLILTHQLQPGAVFNSGPGTKPLRHGKLQCRLQLTLCHVMTRNQYFGSVIEEWVWLGYIASLQICSISFLNLEVLTHFLTAHENSVCNALAGARTERVNWLGSGISAFTICQSGHATDHVACLTYRPPVEMP